MLGSGNSPAQASLSALDLRKLHTLLIRLADTSDLQSARYAALALASYVEQVQV